MTFEEFKKIMCDSRLSPGTPELYIECDLQACWAAAVEAERENCAKVAESHDCETADDTCKHAIAAAIRARTETP